MNITLYMTCPCVCCVQIRIVLSKSTKHFYDRSAEYNPEVWASFEKAGLAEYILTDEDEWVTWNKKGDPVLHIEVGPSAGYLAAAVLRLREARHVPPCPSQLRRWADMLLICPASADIIAKLAAGISDNLTVSRSYA